MCVRVHTGEFAGTHQLLGVLGRAAGLQSLLGACGVWDGVGHHAHWSPHLLHRSAVVTKATLDLQRRG